MKSSAVGRTRGRKGNGPERRIGEPLALGYMRWQMRVPKQSV